MTCVSSESKSSRTGNRQTRLTREGDYDGNSKGVPWMRHRTSKIPGGNIAETYHTVTSQY